MIFSVFGQSLIKMLDLPLGIFFSFWTKFGKNAGLTPCDCFNLWPKFDKNAGLTPCNFLSFWPKFDKIAGLTSWDFFQFLD